MVLLALVRELYLVLLQYFLAEGGSYIKNTLEIYNRGNNSAMGYAKENLGRFRSNKLNFKILLNFIKLLKSIISRTSSRLAVCGAIVNFLSYSIL